MLAAGAMVASLLAVGASPAGAQVLGGGSVNVEANQLIDHRPETVACVGDALNDQMFTDVVDEHVFKDAINCIAYYGITNGSGDGSTFAPNQEVTRAQMAVFIARAAVVAGVDLGTATSAGFTDIGDIWQEAQDAINRLANKGMIPKGGAFRPGDSINRAEMATFLIGLLAEASPTVRIGTEGKNKGKIQLGEGRTPEQEARDAFDWFADARADQPSAVDEAISALWELSVTRGAEFIGPKPPPRPQVLVTVSSTAMINNPAFNSANNPGADNQRAIANPQGYSSVSPLPLAFDNTGKATFWVSGLPDAASHMKQDKSDIDIKVQHLSPAAASGSPVPLPFNYDPRGTVNRGQMAEFITRALAHTSVRPAGVSAQYIPRATLDYEKARVTSGAVVVSVRNSDFEPVSNVTVDLFHIDTPGEDLAFKRDGSCSSEVSKLDPGKYSCEIDGLDSITGGEGDTRPALGSIADGGTTVWAWTGRNKDEVDDDTKLFKLRIPKSAEVTAPTQISVSTEHIGKKAHQGSSVLWTLQLQDKNSEPVSKGYSNTLKFVDEEGANLARVSTTHTFAVNRYQQFRVLDNTESVDDGAGTNSETFTGVFSTERSIDTNTNADITVTVAPTSKYVAADIRGAANRVRVSVTDQYGDPITGVKVRLTTNRTTPTTQQQGFDTNNDGTNDVTVIPIAGYRYLAVGRDGSYTFGYERSGIGTSETDTLTATLEAWDHDGDTTTTGLTQTNNPGDDNPTTIEWAEVATMGQSQAGSPGDAIRAFDKDTDTIFVGANGSVKVLYYDSNDRFNIAAQDGSGSAAKTYAQFEKNLSKLAGYTLTWSIKGNGSRAVNEFTLNMPSSG